MNNTIHLRSRGDLKNVKINNNLINIPILLLRVKHDCVIGDTFLSYTIEYDFT